MVLNDKIVYSPLFSREIADAGMLIAQFDAGAVGRGGGINSVT